MKFMALRKYKGLTLAETLIASLLMASALVPGLRALTAVHTDSTLIERKTRSLCLAQAKMDDIRARSIYSWSSSYAASSLVLDGIYLCNVTDTSVGSNCRDIKVSVGYDLNNDHTLSASEVTVTLETLVARRW